MLKVIDSFSNINHSSSKIRVLSFQSREVLDILLSHQEYHPDYNLSREGRNYKLEKERYGFTDIIWCFSPIGWYNPSNNPRIKIPGKFSKEDFIDGSKFFNFRCEMSLPDNESLNSLVLLELEYDKEDLKSGLTHNSCSYVYVAPYLNLENLVAVYRLNYDRSREAGWYYPEVFVEKTYKDNPLFESDFLCYEA